MPLKNGFIWNLSVVGEMALFEGAVYADEQRELRVASDVARNSIETGRKSTTKKGSTFESIEKPAREPMRLILLLFDFQIQSDVLAVFKTGNGTSR
jgi:hypothetical protein